MLESKPGYLTTEFWLVIAANVAGVIQQIAAPFHIADRYVLLAQTIVTAAYAISRGLAKSGVPSEVLPTSVPPDQGDAGKPSADG